MLTRKVIKKMHHSACIRLTTVSSEAQVMQKQYAKIHHLDPTILSTNKFSLIEFMNHDFILISKRKMKLIAKISCFQLREAPMLLCNNRCNYNNVRVTKGNTLEKTFFFYKAFQVVIILSRKQKSFFFF